MSVVARGLSSGTKLPIRERAVTHHFVQSRTNGLGIGRIVGFENGLVRVEYFHAIERTEERLIPPRDLVAETISPQTRCYVRLPGDERWRAGRLGQRSDDTYEVNFPNKKSH